MKRQSIAEITLAKQVRAIEDEMDRTNNKITLLQAQHATQCTMRDHLSAEITHLRKAREDASDRVHGVKK